MCCTSTFRLSFSVTCCSGDIARRIAISGIFANTVLSSFSIPQSQTCRIFRIYGGSLSSCVTFRQDSTHSVTHCRKMQLEAKRSWEQFVIIAACRRGRHVFVSAPSVVYRQARLLDKLCSIGRERFRWVGLWTRHCGSDFRGDSDKDPWF